ncbi:hypothetical protein ABMA32_19540 [Mesorhizobium sp. VNQ89]|uniref:hypothetical protein n=1 Tax=Mesorhizobium quangtriensis TaxID=3157709 RepID=UPI0032B7B0E7
MKLVGTIVFALAVSVVLSAGVGTVLSIFVGNGNFFVVVFFAVVLVALISVTLFALASFQPVRRQATRRLALFLTVVLCLTTFGMAAAHFGAQGTVAATWPGVQVMLVLLVTCELVVLVHWFIFRHEPQSRIEPAMQFGRAGAVNTGGRK